MDFRGQIRDAFGVDLPIKNGFGSSFETAVGIELDLPDNGYVRTEREYLNYIAIFRNIKWEKISQTLVEHNGRTYDVIEIETRKMNGKKSTKETHYFDITECIQKHLGDWLRENG